MKIYNIYLYDISKVFFQVTGSLQYILSKFYLLSKAIFHLRGSLLKIVSQPLFIHNFKDWYAKIPKGKLVVMQSNNYDQLEEHVNCAKDLEEFETQTPMTKCLYNGTLDLIKYTRYMRIGIR